MRIAEVLEALAARALSREESQATFERLVAGEYAELEVAALLAALKTRGETPEVMAGAVEALLGSAVAFPRPDYPYADCCGTGGDGAGTVNISTAAAFVAAELGIPIAKTGNRSVSSLCGSADVLERLGVRLDPSPDVARRCLDELAVCFVFAPRYHPGVRHAAAVRRTLGVRTVFNLVGPIANAARPPWQMMGIYDPALCAAAARTLALVGREVALVVHGGGVDEVALHDTTQGVLLRDGELREVTISPEEAGLPRAPLSSLAGGGPDANAEWLLALLDGRAPDSHRHAVALNAGALAWAVGRADTLARGAEAALEAISGGGGARRLRRLAELTHGS
ncbi:MAG TPA: anthranilate phosphoribosyltransferase [Gemmatimonadales bacterium]|nr:anthranilate phosphoribosyltransferase [Gemmatimonadales bacterium]